MRGFTGIEIDDKLKGRISEISAQLPGRSISIVNQKSLHVTLHFFEDLSAQSAVKVSGILGSISTAPFEVDVRGISFFGGNQVRIVFAKIDDPDGRILSIHEAVAAQLYKEKIDYDMEKDFVPHITIARSRESGWELREFIEEHNDYDFGSFVVGRVSLKRSDLTPQGPVYTTLFEYEI